MTGRRVFVAFALAALAATAGGVGVLRYRARAASRYVPPVFTDPPPGARAPSTELLGLRVGVTSLAEAKGRLGSSGIACADRSMRAIMGEIREKKREEIRLARERGAPDTVSGASIVSRRTARDDNPQVRLSCDAARADKLPDRARSPSEGRLLLVFDDADTPLRHVSYQRNHRSWDEARRDFEETVAAARARLGEPREAGSGPPGSAPGAGELPKYATKSAVFRFADLEVVASVANLGGRGFSVRESAEVPWPVRADAPRRPH